LVGAIDGERSLHVVPDVVADFHPARRSDGKDMFLCKRTILLSARCCGTWETMSASGMQMNALAYFLMTSLAGGLQPKANARAARSSIRSIAFGE
jgi:hypothetical protein